MARCRLEYRVNVVIQNIYMYPQRFHSSLVSGKTKTDISMRPNLTVGLLSVWLSFEEVFCDLDKSQAEPGKTVFRVPGWGKRETV